MALTKLTFALPEDLAARFLKRVPARERSAYLADALARKLGEREKRLIHASHVANRLAEVGKLEREMDALQERVLEPWDDAPAR